MLTITAIPAFSDNYIWLMSQKGNAWVVDPGDATPVIETLNAQSLSLEGILITHHHRDHTGGINQLLEQWPKAKVFAPHSDKIPTATHRVSEGDTLKLLGVKLSVLEVPAHTLDHIAYFCDNLRGSPAVFCGDTLFSGGCGRVFEGTYTQMHHALQKLATLPNSTAIYCTHEYTLANLNFAKEIEPNNDALEKRLDFVRMLRSDGTITLPSQLSLEKNINPFLRCDQPEVIQAAKQINSASNEVEVFSAIRELKDNF